MAGLAAGVGVGLLIALTCEVSAVAAGLPAVGVGLAAGFGVAGFAVRVASPFIIGLDEDVVPRVRSLSACLAASFGFALAKAAIRSDLEEFAILSLGAGAAVLVAGAGVLVAGVGVVALGVGVVALGVGVVGFGVGVVGLGVGVAGLLPPKDGFCPLSTP